MTPRERVECLVAEETRAMVARIVQRMAPTIAPAHVDRAAEEASYLLPLRAGLADVEIERASLMTDEAIRAAWRDHYEPRVAAMFAGEYPS